MVIKPCTPITAIRPPYANARARRNVAELVKGIHFAYESVVSAGGFVCTDFDVYSEIQNAAGLLCPSLDMMGVQMCSMTLLRRVVPEYLITDGIPYEGYILAAACLMVCYKLRSEGCFLNTSGSICASVAIYVMGPAAAAHHTDHFKLFRDVEAAEAWLCTRYNLFALIDKGPYWYFESELSRYHTEGRLTIEETLACLAAGFFLYGAAAENPTKDVIECIGQRATTKKIGHGLAVASVHMLVESSATECTPDRCDEAVLWTAWTLAVNAADRQLNARVGGYQPVPNQSKQSLACRMTSRETLHRLIVKLECL